jgi:hypothetical protein
VLADRSGCLIAALGSCFASSSAFSKLGLQRAEPPGDPGVSAVLDRDDGTEPVPLDLESPLSPGRELAAAGEHRFGQ